MVFELLMYAAIAIAAVAIPVPELSPVVPVTFVTIAFAAAWWTFIGLLIWLTARRRKNWARLLLFALFATQTGQLAYVGWFSYLNVPRSWTYISITTIEAVAYVLIFTGDGRQWFRTSPVDVESTFE